MPKYRVGRLKGRFCINVYGEGGKRIGRYRLDARDKSEAEREAARVFAALTAPKGELTVGEVWNAFMIDYAGRAIAEAMPFNWRALERRFANVPAESVSIEDCRAHIKARHMAGIKDGTIATELGRLRMVLNWAAKRRLIATAPYIERPSAPKRKEAHLTREQCHSLLNAATMPHVRTFIALALATGARDAALLDLTWSRCDFERGLIDLRNPDISRPHKGRAVVPMNRTARIALLEAKSGALSDHVIEWAGKRVGSVRRALKASAKMAGIGSVSPHMLRHSAAVHMAESQIPMEEIAQYLGHDDVSVTRRVYARFSPTYLRKAAAALEYDDFMGSTNLKTTTFPDGKMPEYMVGATGIEPVTPTMSKKRA